MIETKVQIAADLLPLIRHLWKGGILSIGPYQNEVHLRDWYFHETFPEVVNPAGKHDEKNWTFEKTVNIEGTDVRFYCLHEKEDWDEPVSDA